jgi:hypothetical protein
VPEPLVIHGQTVAPGQLGHPGFDPAGAVPARPPSESPGADGPRPTGTGSLGQNPFMDIPTPAWPARRVPREELARLGPYAAVDTHTPGQPAQPPWRSMRELTEDPAVLEGRVLAVSAALSPGGDPTRVEPRVAASTTHLGLVARLIAPAVAVATLGGSPFDQRLDELWWQDRLGGPYPLSAASAPAMERAPGTEVVLGDGVSVLTTLIAERYRVSPRVLWGNTASAINSAAVQISRQQPDLTERSRFVAQALLSDPRLAHEPGTVGPEFRRASCCLIHRLSDSPARAVCGDCVLLAAR